MNSPFTYNDMIDNDNVLLTTRYTIVTNDNYVDIHF